MVRYYSCGVWLFIDPLKSRGDTLTFNYGLILSMTALENNITQVNLRIAAACNQAHRSNNSVNLLAVSKTCDINAIKSAYELGLRRFGENYAKEAEEKIPFLPKDIEWHFIGPIQSNKTRSIAKHFSWIHSIDRLKIAERLNEQRPSQLPPLQCLIQVNISKEPQKAGVLPEDMMALGKVIANLPRLHLRGLMAIPKAEQTEEDLARDFANMQALLRQLHTRFQSADTLSMGMSADLELAIAHGATMVRVGTDIFGARNNTEHNAREIL